MKTFPLFFLIALALITGCASSGVRDLDPAETGQIRGTGVDSIDVVHISAQVIHSLSQSSAVQNHYERSGQAPVIRLESIRNESRFPIDADILLTRIRGSLNRNADSQFVFLARGSAYDLMPTLEEERNLKNYGAVSPTDRETRSEQFQGADFILTGHLQSLTTQTERGISDYLLYSFQLIDPYTSEIVWEDIAETKREGRIHSIYR